MLSDSELRDLAETVVRNVDALEHSEYYGTDAANAAVNLIRLIESVAERQLAQTPNPSVPLDAHTCGCHRTPTFHVSMTAPSGVTGVTIDMCIQCVLKLLDSPAVQANGRTVHLKRI